MSKSTFKGFLPCPVCGEKTEIKSVKDPQPDCILECPYCHSKISYSYEDYFTQLKLFTPNKYCMRVKSHKSVPSVEYCSNCMEWMCKECSKEHKRTKSFHLTINKEIYQRNICKKHNKKKYKFCEKCSIEYCDDPSCHENHLSQYIDSEYLNDIYEFYPKTLKDYTHVIEDLYEQTKKELENLYKRLEQSFQKAKKSTQGFLRLFNILNSNYNYVNPSFHYIKSLSHFKDFEFISFEKFLQENPSVNILNKYEKVISYFSSRILLIPEINNQYYENFSLVAKENLDNIFFFRLIDEKTLLYQIPKRLFLVKKLYNSFNLGVSNTDFCQLIRDAIKIDESKILISTDFNTSVYDMKLNQLQNIYVHNIIHSEYNFTKNRNFNIFGRPNSSFKKAALLSDSRVALCYQNKGLDIFYSMASGQYSCIKTIEVIIPQIIELKNKKYLVLININKNDIEFWNNRTYECEKILDDIYANEEDDLIEINNNRILLTGSGELYIINCFTFQIESQISQFELPENIKFFSFNNDAVFYAEGNEITKISTFDFKPVTKYINWYSISNLQVISNKIYFQNRDEVLFFKY